MKYQGDFINLANTDKTKCLYCIHPLGGEVSCYRPIANALKDTHTVYGIKRTQFDVSENLLLHDVATSYSEQIKQMQPSSAVSLIGWSIGGIIALDMTHTLETLGTDVDKVILIDTYTPHELIDLSLLDNDELLYHLIRLSYANANQTPNIKIPILLRTILWFLTQINLRPSILYKLAALFKFDNFEEDLNKLRKNIVKPDSVNDPIPKWVEIGRKIGAIPTSISDNDIFQAYQQVRLEMYAYKHFQLKFNEKAIHFINATKGYHDKINRSDWSQYCKTLTTHLVDATHYNIIYSQKTVNIIRDILLDDTR